MVMKRPVCNLGLSLLVALTVCAMFAVCVSTSALDNPTTAVSRKAGNSASQQPSAAVKQRAMTAFGNLPLTFEPNQGQTDSQVKFLSRGHGYNLFLTSKEAVFTLPLASKNSALLDFAKQKQMDLTAKSAPGASASDPTDAVMRMTMLGANPQPVIAAEDQQPGKTSYFIGNDPKNWHTGIPGFARVHYRDVYPGVDVIYHGARQLEFDVVVNAGAKPDNVELSFDGARSMAIDDAGDLVLTSEAGEVRLQHPVAYQEKNGVRRPVNARFVMKNATQVAFALGRYDHSRQLVIDPPISVSYATYLGGGGNGTLGTGEEAATGINVDSGGYVYVTGGTSSFSFPGCTGTCASQLNGKLLAYITQITPVGTLGYSTIFGGTTGNVFDQGLAIDSVHGNLYITGGTSSTDLPNAPGHAQGTYGGGATDGFVASLTLDGKTVNWSTYVGGSSGDEAFGISLDSLGDVFVAGQTTSADFPVKNPLPQGGSYNGAGDAFVTEVSADGSQFLVSSYIGGSGLDLATGVSWNATTGNVSVGGSTQSPTSGGVGLPVTAGAFQQICGTDGTCNSATVPVGPKDDAFVVTFNPSTSQYVFVTYVGGEFFDDATALTTDAAGNVYITGKTQSQSFPTQNPLQPSLGGGVQNAFVTALNPTGSALVYSTYLGGNGFDEGLGIVVDTNNDAYITGSTTSTTFPTQNPSQQNFGGGNTGQFMSDAFVSELNWNSPTLSLVFSTYLGGSGDEDIFGGFIGIDSNENIYVIGDTNSLNFPVQPFSGGTVIDAALNAGQGIKPQCQAKNLQGQLITVACTDSFVAMYGSNTEGIVVTYTGTGSGTITSYPAGMNCTGNPCAGNFPTGTTVTLTPTAAANSVFTGWSGDNCSGTGTCAAVLNSNQFVTASFTQTAANVAVTVVGSGTVTSNPAGVTCPGTCTAAFSLGTKVTLTASPGSKITFTGWSGGGCSGTGTCAVTVNANQAVNATFQGFDITATALSPSSVAPGASATSTATITGSGNFNTNSVTLACSVTPAVTLAPTCKFGAVAGGKSTLTVSTTGPASLLTPSQLHHSGVFYAMFLPIGGMAFLSVGFGRKSRKKKLLGFVLVCMVLSGLVFLASCSGGGSQGSSGNAGTPAGSYTITVTGTATGFTQGGNPPQLALTVQ